jgi:putative endonuclease
VLDEGRIVERGTHAQLLARGGLYASMWNRQREAEAAREKLREVGEDAIESTHPNRNPPGSMSCFVYLLGSNGKGGYRTYVGWTTDLERRLAQHNAGKGARSTRGRTWELLHSERFDDRAAAMSREWHLKRDRAFRKSLSKG